MLLGSGAGLWLMHVLQHRWPLLMLGVYVFLMGLDQLRRSALTPRRFPAYAPVLIVCSACIVLGEMALAGKLSSAELWHQWLWLIGAALLGTAVGDRLAHRVSRARLTRVMAALLMMSGLVLVKGFFFP